MSERLRRLNVAAGGFFFKYRNALFPATLAVFLASARPRASFAHPALEQAMALAGLFIAALGESVRLATIGFEYIERGGRHGRVYASRLVDKGIYGLTRNPMYLGNLLIVVGIVLVSGAPAGYRVAVPFFCFVYQAIISAEEEFLRKRFGKEYRDYCARVPRFLPSFRGLRRAFRGTRFSWRRPFKQDLSTIAWVAMVLVALPCWRAFFLKGRDASRPLVWKTGLLELGILALYGLLVCLKKQKSPLFYTTAQRVEARA